MNIKALSYIVAIERYGSISRAAEKLFVSQPYLSKVVRDLEEEYQITIFTRNKEGITPTESGRVFIDMSGQLLENVDQFHSVFKEDVADFLRFRISSATTSYSMDSYLQLLQRHPEKKIRFYYKEQTNYEVINDIYTNAADVGVLVVTESNWRMVEQLLKLRHIEFHKIADLATYLVVGEGHPLTLQKEIKLEDLYQYSFVLYAMNNDIGIRAIENIYNDHSMENLIDWNRIRQITYVYSRAGLHNLLTQTDAIAFGSREVRDQTRQFHIVSLPFPLPDRELEHTPSSYLCYIHLKDKRLSAVAREYIDILTSTYG